MNVDALTKTNFKYKQ